MALENDNPLLRKNYTPPLLKATYYGKLVVIVVAFQLAASPYSAKLLKALILSLFVLLITIFTALFVNLGTEMHKKFSFLKS